MKKKNRGFLTLKKKKSNTHNPLTMYRALKSYISSEGNRAQKKRFNQCVSNQFPASRFVTRYILAGGSGSVQVPPRLQIGSLDFLEDFPDESPEADSTDEPSRKRSRANPESPAPLFQDADGKPLQIGLRFPDRKAQQGGESAIYVDTTGRWVAKLSIPRKDFSSKQIEKRVSRTVQVHRYLEKRQQSDPGTQVRVPRLHSVHSGGSFVRMKNSFGADGYAPCIIEENVGGGHTMMDIMNKLYDTDDPSRSQLYEFLKTIFVVLKEMQDNQMCHNDFKLENLLPRYDAEGRLAGATLIDLTDFTVATQPAFKQMLRFKGHLGYWTFEHRQELHIPHQKDFTDTRTLCVSMTNAVVPSGDIERDTDQYHEVFQDFFRLLQTIYDTSQSERVEQQLERIERFRAQ